MAKCVVLWASHKQAVIVSITDGVETILHVDSKAKGHVGEKWSHHLSEYYRKVIHALRDAQSIFIFGPARVKMALKEEILKTEPLAHRIVGTETADTMTENQLVARAGEICGTGLFNRV
jgi:alcohol dehydrogenase YqhD (iron-dependent ADH family)